MITEGQPEGAGESPRRAPAQADVTPLGLVHPSFRPANPPFVARRLCRGPDAFTMWRMTHGAILVVTSLLSIVLVGGRIANSDDMLLWVSAQLALGVTASMPVVLAAQILWSLRRTIAVRSAGPTANEPGRSAVRASDDDEDT